MTTTAPPSTARRHGRVLQYGDFRWLTAGTTVSALGNAITPVAIAFVVLDLGGTAVELGLVEAVFAAARVVTTLAGGVLGDRVSRKVMMEGASAASAVVMALMAGTVIAGYASIGLIAVLGGIAGIASALSEPSARAMVRLVVPPEHVSDAVALRTLARTTAMTVGFAVGGILVAAVGSGWAMAIDAGTFAWAAFAFSRLRVPHVRTPAESSMLADLGEGFRETIRHDWLWILILQALLYHLFYSGAQSVLGPIVVGDGLGRASWGFALAALMGGFVVGGLFCLRVRPRRPMRVGVVLLSMTGLFPLAMATADSLWPIVIGAFLHGVGLQMFDVFWEQSIQANIPEDKLARVFSVDAVGSFVARPLGLALTGPIAHAIGYDAWLLVIAAIISGSSLLSLLAPGVRRLERREVLS